MAYSKTNWANGTSPAINASNLNKIEQELYVLDADSTTAANNISALQTETQDIRTGANGTEYSSAGDAVRGQVNALSSEINAHNFVEGVGYIKEIYINQTGVSAGVAKLTRIDMRSSEATYGRITYSDADGSAIVAHSMGYVNGALVYGLIPIYLGSMSETTVCGYIIINWDALVGFNARLDVKKAISVMARNLDYSPYIASHFYEQNIAPVIQKNTDDADTLNAIVGRPTEDVVDNVNQFTDTDVILHGGTTRHFDGFYTTPFLPCVAGSTLKFTLTAFRSSSVTIDSISFFDVQYNYIDGWCPDSNTSNSIVTQTVVAPANTAYFKAQNYPSVLDEPLVTLYASGLCRDVEELQENKKVCNVKIAFIGDSLTQGVTGGEGSSSIAYCDKPFPDTVKELMDIQGFNVTVKNFGRHGLSSRTYWEKVIPDDGQYHSPEAGAPGDTFEVDNTYDGYVIMLGTNGYLNNNTIDADTDIGPGETYLDYAETPCGCYCKIIEYIMDHSSDHAKIYLVAPIYANAESHEQKMIDTLPTIEALGRRYQIPVINALYESGLGKFNKDTYYNQTDLIHLTQNGYNLLGSYIASKLMSVFGTPTPNIE